MATANGTLKDTITKDFLGDYENKGKKMVDYLMERVSEINGDPSALLAATDEYCYGEGHWMMHVGDKKGTLLKSRDPCAPSIITIDGLRLLRHVTYRAIVRKLVQQLAPKTCLEIGTYCGYSAVLMASVLPVGSRYITLESREELVNIARQFVKLAGANVNTKITIVGRRSEDVIPTLRESLLVDTLDFVFMDHWEEFYVRDLKLLESHGLLKKGTVILADNVIHPGAPDYLEYVQSSEKYHTELIHSTLEYSNKEDAVAMSVNLG